MTPPDMFCRFLAAKGALGSWVQKGAVADVLGGRAQPDPCHRTLLGARRGALRSAWAVCALGGLLALACVAGLHRVHAVERGAWLAKQLAVMDGGLAPELREEKHAAMSASALAFYRGSAALYWLDLGTSPQLSQFGGVAHTRTWLSGDAHPNNFGSVGDGRGGVVYDLDDFDESVVADYQLDVWRLATALIVFMRDRGGFSSADEVTVVDAFSERYLTALEACVGTDIEKTTSFTAANTYGKLNDFLQGVARKKSRDKLLQNYTRKDERGVRGLSPAVSSDLADVSPTVVAAIREAMPGYGATLHGGLRYSAQHFTVKSVAQRLHAGLGSLGSLRYYVQIEGATSEQDDDILLDVKAQKAPSAYRNLAGDAMAATDQASGGSAAGRVVTAARSLSTAVDDYLGTMKIAGVTYSVRERSPWKDHLDTEILNSVGRLSKLAEQWATVLAYAHARADQDSPGHQLAYDFEQAVVSRTRGKHAEFRTLVRSVATSNAVQVGEDYQAFRRTRRSPQ